MVNTLPGLSLGWDVGGIVALGGSSQALATLLPRETCSYHQIWTVPGSVTYRSTTLHLLVNAICSLQG